MNRIKLTEEDFFISQETDATRAYLEICTDTTNNEETKLIKQQILDDQEKSDRLTKEIAYAKWKEGRYEELTGDKDHENINDMILATLQLIEGTHSHDPGYDEDFERQYNGN